MPALADRVKETTTTTGTGALTLAGTAPSGFQTFASAFGSTALVVGYAIDDGAGLWEVGKGTFNGTTGLTRDVVRSGSSGPGNLVTFAAGTKTVFCTASAELLDNGNLSMQQFTSGSWFSM